MSATENTPQAIDTKLAELHSGVELVAEAIASLELTALRQAGADFYYRGRRRVTDMPLTEAEAVLAGHVAQHAATADPESPDHDFGYIRIGTANIGQIRRTVEKLAAARAELAELEASIAELDKLYTGWSRFFLVTSSAGHVHSSMSCHTCRPTTTYGWLPELSGQSEAEAVAKLGPALCSSCFPSAPTDWVGGKITKAQAAKAAH